MMLLNMLLVFNVNGHGAAQSAKGPVCHLLLR